MVISSLFFESGTNLVLKVHLIDGYMNNLITGLEPYILRFREINLRYRVQLRC